MRAASYSRTGPAREVLTVENLPTPAPAAGEVRVKLSWSGVNPSDVKSRAGLRATGMPFPRVIPHSDGAGVIDEVGEGVDRARIAERVWTWNAAWARAYGTAAEYVVLPSEQAVRLPGNVDLAAGACLGIPALTAYHSVMVDGGVEGKNVLVTGGAGAVGHYAVQLARLKGAKRVVATVSTPEKAELARSAGAVTVNYKMEDVVARCNDLTEGELFDRIIEVDLSANVEADTTVIRQGGNIVVYGSNALQIQIPFVPLILGDVRLHFFIVFKLGKRERDEATHDLTSLLQAGALSHNIAHRMPLSRIAAAHDLIEKGGASGNVVLSVD